MFIPKNYYLSQKIAIGAMTTVKAIGLLSGGLDSILATEMILKQGIEVTAFNVRSPFCLCKKDGCAAVDAAKQLNVPLKMVAAGNDYLRMLRKPKHGYGRNMNPCIDCRIFLFKRAKKYAKETGADFIFTGEVLDERPMSQHYPAMMLIEKEAGLKGKILRPLSAKLLPETDVEKKGLVDRSKLMDIEGRSRKPQFKLAEEYNIKDFPCPAGGCLLTYEEYAKKIRDLFANKKHVSMADIALLRIGRHFRMGKNKFVVGREETENKLLVARKTKNEYYFELPDVVGPVTILQGPKTKSAIETAAKLTAFYSDAKSGKVKVNFGRASLNESIVIAIPAQDYADNLRVGKVTK
jgi:tRNA U34 2-thiouridine synthase MnmA/TrmU